MLFSQVKGVGEVLRAHQARLVRRVAIIVLNEFLKLVPIVLLKYIVDDIIAFSPAKIAQLALFAGITLVTLIVLALFRAHMVVAHTALVTSIERDMLRRSKHQMLRLDMDYHEQYALGKKISIVNDGAKDLRELIYLFLNEIIPVAIQVLMTIAMIAWYSWQIALVFVAFGPVIYVINVQYARRAVPMRKSFKHAYHDASASLGQSIANIRTVKEFNMQDAQLNEYAGHLQTYYERIMVRVGLAARVVVTEETVIAFARFGTLALAIYLVSNGSITAGTLVLAFSLSEKAFINLTRVGSFHIKIDEYLTSIEDLAELHQQRESVQQPPNAIPVAGFRKEIRFEHVAFNYPLRSRLALKDLDFTIKKGESLAIVGRSGGGKTTIIKLLLRHYDCCQGTLLLDDINIRTLDLKGYRSLFGVVSQEVELFNKTIAENIAYGANGVSHEMIVPAAQEAGAHDFILSMPQGYETVVGERGVRLSGGQKQRVAIARALLRRPQVLIFDEATSSLDTESEQRIQEAIWRLSKDYTIIIIAHRLSTILKADNVLVLDNGKVAAFGPLKSLSKKNPLFKKMLKLQHLGEIRE